MRARLLLKEEGTLPLPGGPTNSVDSSSPAHPVAPQMWTPQSSLGPSTCVSMVVLTQAALSLGVGCPVLLYAPQHVAWPGPVGMQLACEPRHLRGAVGPLPTLQIACRAECWGECLGGEGEAEGLVRVNAASHGDVSEGRQGRALLGRWPRRPMAPRGVQALSLLTDLGLVPGEGGHPDLKTEHSVHGRPCALSGDWFWLMRLGEYLPAWTVSFCERFLASKRGLGMLLRIYCSHPAPSLMGGAGPVSW